MDHVCGQPDRGIEKVPYGLAEQGTGAGVRCLRTSQASLQRRKRSVVTASIPNLALSPPEGDFAAWIQMEDVRRFLFSTTVEDVLLHYSSHVGTTEYTGSTFLSSALLPRQFAKPHHYDDLAQWNFNPAYKTWGYGGPFTKNGVPHTSCFGPLHGRHRRSFSGSCHSSPSARILFCRTDLHTARRQRN
jgi:hypothetical protein